MMIALSPDQHVRASAIVAARIGCRHKTDGSQEWFVSVHTRYGRDYLEDCESRGHADVLLAHVLREI